MTKGNRRVIAGRIFSAVLCAVLTASCMVPSYAANLPAEKSAAAKDFDITNPYEEVNWDEWGAYKTQLHSHTTASDGYLAIKEFAKAHYDLDYDIVALTDHGTINRGWNNEPQLVPLMRLVKKERTKMADVIPLSEDEYSSYLNGTASSDNRTHKNGMLDVPKGIELNMATPVCDCHLTGYFSDYGQGLAGVYGDYETPSKGVTDAGGISMLSHVGEYVYPDKDSENYVGQRIDEYFVNKFARIFLDNKGSSLGMGINSAADCHTRCDRILYDQILAKTIPNGVIPWGFTFSDSHGYDSVNDAYTMMLMEKFTMEDFRKSMEKGQFFSVSHFSYGFELNGMAEMPGFVEENADAINVNDTPMVTRVAVNNENDTITIAGTDFDSITWVSNGNVIRRETGITSGTATLDLHDAGLLDSPSLYIRFYITSSKGICYSQPFVIKADGETFSPVTVPKTHDLPLFLRKLVTVVDWICFKFSPIIWAFKYFALGYSVFDR